MSDTARCSGCGAELLQDATPQGLCAACLLKLGLSSTNIPSVESAPPPAEPPRKTTHRQRRWGWKILLIVAASAFALALAVFYYRRQPPPPRVIRFSLSVPNSEDFAISPDGRRIAFTATNEEGKRLLWIHPLDTFLDTPLAETEDAAAPFWSPDSRFIGFFARGKLKKVDIGGGASETLCDAPTGKGGTWGIDGVIVFERNASGVLYRVSGRGGIPEAATKIDRSDRQEITHRWPHFLPDGRHFIYTATTNNPENDGVFIASLDTGQVKRIMNGRLASAYAEQSLLFVRNGMLLVQPFGLGPLNTSGDARAVRFAENVDRFSISTNGVLAYRKREQIRPSPLGWFDRAGKGLGIIDGLTGAGQFSVSPDGRTVAASRQGDIWVSDLDRGVLSRFTFDAAEDTFPVWSPDGSRIVFLSNRGGRRSVYQKVANAATNEELLLTAPQLESVESWSPDGRFIVYTSRDDKGKSIVWALPLDGDRKPFMIQSAFNLREPRFSPDAHWLAYVSDESGQDEIYIETFPPGGSKWQVSLDGGTKPKWRRDGMELFYVSKERTFLMSVPVGGGAPSLRLGTPRPLFGMPRGSYDLSGDGQRFLMSLPEEDKPSVPIDIVINWPTELQR